MEEAVIMSNTPISMLYYFENLKHVKLGPVHPARHVNVIHEALYVQRQVGGVGTHQLLQFLTLLVQP